MMKVYLLVFLLAVPLARAEGPYPVDPASQPHEGVPKGTVTKHHFEASKLYPGTSRDYWVYTPAQYDAAKPACLMVFQDGGGYAGKVPVVFDNLIQSGEMPVTIGVFIDPGVVAAPDDKAQPRFNRSYEYDGFTADYAKFLNDELLPEVAKDRNISTDPDHRGIAGASSGGIAAFNVAWQRPDQFRRVYSMVGTFVGLRGGEEFSTLVRKTEPKPLRIFLQDGSNDNNIYCGDWWMANQMMERSLQFSGYEVGHEWGEGPHSGQHGSAIMPTAMRFLWKDFPKPVAVNYEACRSKAKEMLIPGKDWEKVGAGYGHAAGLTAAPDGTVFFTDTGKNRVICQVGADGKVSPFLENPKAIGALAFGPDGRLYGCRGSEIVSWDLATKQEKIHATGLNADALTIGHNGTIYAADPEKHAVWIIRPGQEKALGSDAFRGVSGISLTPDQTRLDVADPGGRYVWSATLAGDGSVANVQPYHQIHLPPADADPTSHAAGLQATRDGWLLVASVMGVQICDQPGRVNLILPPPTGATPPTGVCLGGKDHKTLYITCGSKVFRRETQMAGACAADAPVKPPMPHL